MDDLGIVARAVSCLIHKVWNPHEIEPHDARGGTASASALKDRKLLVVLKIERSFREAPEIGGALMLTKLARAPPQSFFRGRLARMKEQTTRRYTVRLIGRRARGRRIAGSALSDLSAILVEAARGALRQRVEGRSTARSAPPDWLEKAAEFDIVGFEGSGTVFVLEAPVLGEAAPWLFAGQAHFASLDAGDTALNVMAEALLHAVDERIDSDFFDQPLLTTFRRFGRLLAAGG
ncbi:MAG TPA: hypothetical protein VFO89_09825, partial [Thermoanaerobaculia bacterium]|nr:hypothetical protein [Thermoanaerobaculia bacterium]